MLISFALVIVVGIIFKKLFEFIKFPGLIGLIMTGLLLGPYALNVLHVDFLSLSNNLREVALIIIIFRAGLNLDIEKLLKNKLSVALLSFVPATFEIGAMIIFGPLLLGLSIIDSAILGCIIGAVSPAVIVPSMINIIDQKYGTEKGIPQMIMSAASVDDIYVITLFLALISAAQSGSSLSISIVVQILSSIILGVIIGLIIGYMFNYMSRYLHISNMYLFLIVMSILLMINNIEVMLEPYISISSLLSIMSFGVILSPTIKSKISKYFTESWQLFEILLFTLIGSQLDVSLVINYGIFPLLIIITSLVFRIIGVMVSLINSPLALKERLFVAMSFTPKATVQAAIGPIPLALGFSSGNVILTTSILAILITAPLGYYLINKYYKLLLRR